MTRDTAPEGVESGQGAEQAIKQLFVTYEHVLNTSDLSLAMSLYAEDGVFMEPHRPTAVGKPAILAAYEKLFAKVDHHVVVKLDDHILASGSDYAFARTTTTGSCTFRATGEEVPDAVQQAWVLKSLLSETGRAEWRIASYSFSPTG